MECPFPTTENLPPILPAGDTAEPHVAFHLVLGYLRLPELLSARQVCRDFRDGIATDGLLWQNITVEPPLSARLTDDILLWITAFSGGNLKSLALLRCFRITDYCLLQIFDQNPSITKLCIPGCTSVTADGIVRVVLRFAEHEGRLKCLRLHGIRNINGEQLSMIKSLLPKSLTQEASQSSFYNYWSSHPLNGDDERPIDVDICPKCSIIRMIFNCTREDCRMMRNRRSPCRGCYFCIVRCEDCGGCLDTDEIEQDTACSHFLCTGCWFQLPKCDYCNRPYCSKDRKSEGLPASASFLCDNCTGRHPSNLTSLSRSRTYFL